MENSSTRDASGQEVFVGDTIATPNKEGFDFPYEYYLANKIGEVKRIECYPRGDFVIVDITGIGLSRFREFEITKL